MARRATVRRQNEARTQKPLGQPGTRQLTQIKADAAGFDKVAAQDQSEAEMNDFDFGAKGASPQAGGSEGPRAEERPARGAKDRGARGSRAAWFAGFAPATILPLLERAARDLQRRGYRASARLTEGSGRLIAELEAVPPGLPAGARPPRLAITASRPPRQQNPSPDRPLLIEFTGTFPHAGASGGFGGEVDYTTIYPAQLEEKVADFLDMATA